MATSILSKGRSLLGYGPSHRRLRRSMTSLAHEQYPPGFYFWPNYFTDEEQSVLIAASLYKLDGLESRQARKQRNNYWISNNVSSNDLIKLFAPDELYEFEEVRTFQYSFPIAYLTSYVYIQGHYDGVIHQYREMHLSSWPVEEFKGLKPILERLYLLCPTPLVQTHLLHLASHGYILPHIDNVDSSGSWILGVSLGAERTLRMREAENTTEGFHIKLLSGSVYLQRLNSHRVCSHVYQTYCVIV